jgi:hypothetical protein
MKKILISCLLIICCTAAIAQTDTASVRKLPAVRTTSLIKIDGKLDDIAWKTAPIADKFIEWRPGSGKPENEKTRTEVYVLYDDDAIYVSGFLHESTNDSISKELVGRDVVGVNDFVGVIFDTYKDQINGFGYYVTALNEQFDAKYANGNEDGSWNSVFQSATQIVPEGGWTFEMRIPYSAIRFGKKPIQDWGFNITRRRSKTGQQYMWHPVDPQKLGFLTQFGLWTGVSNIKPPLRLSFSPYFSTYLNHYPYNLPGVKNWSSSVNGGMDVKYGISNSFTLDMTLIPDFGQVQSDNQVLNLSPFEVRYNENRSFFTEGTELFNKGDLFYSRRVGGTPLHYGDVYSWVKPGETVIKNPSETKLINATKVSGRTQKGLGIGVFNAVTRAEYATIMDNAKNEYEVETNPLTNYNIIVFDQTLKHNSSVSLINTNVWRSGHDYEANVTAGIWDLYDKNVDWNFWGRAATSQLIGYLPGGKTQSGYLYNINIGKFKGPWNFQLYRNTADDKYEQNDLGYFTNNNYVNYGGWMGYKITKPHSFYNRLFFNLNINYSERYKPKAYQNLRLNGNVNGQLKNLAQVGIGMNYFPVENDFYEPRRAGKVFRRPGSYLPRGWYYSNEAKKYSWGLEGGIRIGEQYRESGWDAYIFNQYRFNKKLSVSLNSYLEFRNNNAGYAYQTTDSLVFGLRDRRTAENTLNIKYNFNNKMGLNFRLRHYWSKVEYNRFFNLKEDGNLQDKIGNSKNPNSSANFFNIDFVYTWQFAQGSFLNVGWKDASSLFSQDVDSHYFKNLSNTINESQAQNFSVKVIYYLDYLDIKKKKTPKP